jgi:hypothetical protein
MSISLRWFVFVPLLASCGMTINGKKVGSSLGASSGASALDPGGGDSSSDARDDGIEAYAAAPVDPWAGVANDQPVRISDEDASSLKVRDIESDCSAVHDHCLMRKTWFIEGDSQRDSNLEHRYAVPAVFGPDEPGPPWNVQANRPNTSGGYTAYRTVPATATLLAAGALVAALNYPAVAPSSGGAAYGQTWNFGIVDRVDWSAGRLYLVARTEPFQIASTRVAVLSWSPGGKLSILGGHDRKQIVVAANDVIAPKADTGSIADPWSAVGADKQPMVVIDRDPILAIADRSCDAAHDHCLRPWVWFVASKGDAVPGRWTGQRFVPADSVDGRIERAGMAYRTVPATSANLHKSAVVVVYSTDSAGPSAEDDALGPHWQLGKVAEVRADAGLVKLDGDDDYRNLALVRVAVLQWFPGEQTGPVQ